MDNLISSPWRVESENEREGGHETSEEYVRACEYVWTHSEENQHQNSKCISVFIFYGISRRSFDNSFYLSYPLSPTYKLFSFVNSLASLVHKCLYAVMCAFTVQLFIYIHIEYIYLFSGLPAFAIPRSHLRFSSFYSFFCLLSINFFPDRFLTFICFYQWDVIGDLKI